MYGRKASVRDLEYPFFFGNKKKGEERREGERMLENTASAGISLTEEELRRIDENLRQIPIMGDRYPAAYAKRVGL